MAGSQLLVEDGVMRHDADAAIAADGSAGLVSRTLVSGGRAAVRTSGGTTASETKDEPSDVVDDTILLFSPRLVENEAKFLDKVKQVVDEHHYCVVVVGEGLKNEAGEEIGADKNRLDAFGHPVLSGAADKLAEIVQGKLDLKTRTVKLGYAQRAAEHFASATDSNNAYACGVAGVKAAVEGKSGFMVKIVRNTNGNGSIKWGTDLQDLAEVANVEHFIPRDWISEDGFLPNEKFVEYARPLIEGEVKFPIEGGLPKFVAFDKTRVDKVLPARG